jgi:hypothetical protein
LEYYFTDGGRLSSSHKNEKRDCTVRALAVAGQMSYDTAHGLLKEFGRKDGHGFHSKKGLPKITGGRSCKRSGTVGKFCKENPVGRFYCGIRGHAFAVIDGVVHDWNDNLVKPKSRITSAWRVS